MRQIHEDKIREDNFNLGVRILNRYNIYNNRPSNIDLKKYDEEYQKNQYYKKIGSKFNLPKIQKTW
jgi:hypothetical protein